jgi:hypothetical protein
MGYLTAYASLPVSETVTPGGVDQHEILANLKRRV